MMTSCKLPNSLNGHPQQLPIFIKYALKPMGSPHLKWGRMSLNSNLTHQRDFSIIFAQKQISNFQSIRLFCIRELIGEARALLMCRKTPTYEECYMMELITRSLGWENLQLADKPDIMRSDKSLGIEVAACIPEEQRKAEKLLERQYNCCLKERDALWLYRYKVELFEKIRTDNENYLRIISERIVKKIDKHKNYEQTDVFGLALFTIYSGDLRHAVQEYRKIFEPHSDEIDFLIFDVANQGALVYISNQGQTTFHYDDTQFEVAIAAYAIYQRELDETSTTRLL
jgi:hypothetical protein